MNGVVKAYTLMYLCKTNDNCVCVNQISPPEFLLNSTSVKIYVWKLWRSWECFQLRTMLYICRIYCLVISASGVTYMTLNV